HSCAFVVRWSHATNTPSPRQGEAAPTRHYYPLTRLPAVTDRSHVNGGFFQSSLRRAQAREKEDASLSKRRSTGRRTGVSVACNRAPGEQNVEVFVRSSGLAECAFHLIQQTAEILETNADLLKDTALSIGRSSMTREHSTREMLHRAQVLRLNASRMKQRAAA